MKKIISMLVVLLLMVCFGVFALGSGDSETSEQESATVSKNDTAESELGDYSLVIDSCRMAKDYEGKAVVIVKYIFTNNKDEDGAAFYIAFDDNVYQNGVGLNEAYVLADSVNYNSDNKTKEIKKGASIDVEVAYVLNDTKTDIEVEVSELIGFNDKKIVKKFSIE